MAKAELGNKRICASCATKFYDMNKSPIVCPKCGTVLELTSKPSRAAASAAPPAAVAPEVEKEAEQKVDFVSLDEADREQAGAKKATADVDVDDDFDIDDGVLADDDDDDDAFLPDDEDEDDDVSGLLGSGLDDDDEDV